MLHGLGWVHRYITAENVLETEDGTVKLADLEFARSMDDTKNLHTFREVS